MDKEKVMIDLEVNHEQNKILDVISDKDIIDQPDLAKKSQIKSITVHQGRKLNG